MNENLILNLLISRFGELYTDNTFEKHLTDAKAGKCKAWTDYPTHEECEKVRKELIIQRTLNDQIPQVEEKLNLLLGNLLFTKADTDMKIYLCSHYLKKLKKFKNKKKLTYKDTYKVDDLFREQPTYEEVKKHVKIDLTPEMVLGFVEKYSGNTKFMDQLFNIATLSKLNGRK